MTTTIPGGGTGPIVAPRLVEHFFRREYGRLVAVLTRTVGLRHIDGVEDAVQDPGFLRLELIRERGVDFVLREDAIEPNHDQPASKGIVGTFDDRGIVGHQNGQEPALELEGLFNAAHCASVAA